MAPGQGLCNKLNANVLARQEKECHDRFAVIDALSELEAAAKGSYYINMIAVFPECRQGGTGRALTGEAERQARHGGFERMALATFEADTGLMSFYRRLGFEIAGTRPITPHPALHHGGNWALMVRELDR